MRASATRDWKIGKRLPYGDDEHMTSGIRVGPAYIDCQHYWDDHPEISMSQTWELIKSDACLISAAPNLLAALKTIIKEFGPIRNEPVSSKRSALSDARKAVDKATGGKRHHKALIKKYGLQCSICRSDKRSAGPTFLLPQEVCRLDGYRDQRPELTDAEWSNA